jgi:hypothetical protein
MNTASLSGELRTAFASRLLEIGRIDSQNGAADRAIAAIPV